MVNEATKVAKNKTMVNMDPSEKDNGKKAPPAVPRLYLGRGATLAPIFGTENIEKGGHFAPSIPHDKY